MFFVAIVHVLLLLLELSFHRHNEKSEIRSFFYLIADILIKVLEKYSLSSPLPNI